MPLILRDDTARLDGACTVEEAEPLAAFLRDTPGAAVDLSACVALHAALAQVLLAARPRIAAPPPDPILAAALAAALSDVQVMR